MFTSLARAQEFKLGLTQQFDCGGDDEDDGDDDDESMSDGESEDVFVVDSGTRRMRDDSVAGTRPKRINAGKRKRATEEDQDDVGGASKKQAGVPIGQKGRGKGEKGTIEQVFTPIDVPANDSPTTAPSSTSKQTSRTSTSSKSTNFLGFRTTPLRVGDFSFRTTPLRLLQAGEMIEGSAAFAEEEQRGYIQVGDFVYSRGVGQGTIMEIKEDDMVDLIMADWSVKTVELENIESVNMQRMVVGEGVREINEDEDEASNSASNGLVDFLEFDVGGGFKVNEDEDDNDAIQEGGGENRGSSVKTCKRIMPTMRAEGEGLEGIGGGSKKRAGVPIRKKGKGKGKKGKIEQ
ncbi:hypothetical protein TrRE_jg13585 [Triparma retinervis]|uniref:Uncharacterized protein n=1 Tax=Triparma retinervis TaxID=2557542 RepID=A0A9W7FWP8_9STRA|nr:hypothetical protein TrRE_jg13585 [Triparma retinervis]